MKRLIAVTIIAIMMFAMGATAFALVAETASSAANPPVWVSGISVSDAWMSGLTMQNWNGSLTQQAYAEGNYIWFIARISVSAPEDTDAEHLWTGNGEDHATLTIQGKDNCLNLTSANMATLARIDGMNVSARQINNVSTNVTATANSAKFTFSSASPSGMSDGVLQFSTDNLSNLGLDGIYAKNSYYDSTTPNYNASGVAIPYSNAATLQKDFYLHFMGIVNAATEGVCVATLKVNGSEEFVRQGATNNDNYDQWYGTPYSTPTQIGTYSDYNGYSTWYNWQANYTGTNWAGYYNSQFDDTVMLPGDRSVPVILYNTYNQITYAIAEINGEATPWSEAQGWRGGYSNGGSIYVLMSQDCQTFRVAFHVDTTFRGLLTWDEDYRSGAPVYTNASQLGTLASSDYPFSWSGDADIAARTGEAGDFDFFNNRRTWDAAYYMPLTSNDTSASGINLVASYHGGTMATSELEAIFNFFGFAYTNPTPPTDEDFLLNSKLTSTAEARYNVANAVVTTPDTTVVIPQTGDAASSTGLILIASAILAAAAVGFVLSKRARD